MARFTVKELTANIAKIKTAGAQLQALVHVTALGAMEHCREHGDVGPLSRLGQALPQMVRVKGYAAWVEAFAPIVIDRATLAAKLKKGWRPEDFKVDDAEAEPFWLHTLEKEPTAVTAEAILKYLTNLVTPKATAGREPRPVSPKAKLVAENLLSKFSQAEIYAIETLARQAE